MSSKFNLVLIGLVLVATVVRMTVFTVDEREHVIKFRFGEIVKADYQPGLHFKLSLIHI